MPITRGTPAPSRSASRGRIRCQLAPRNPMRIARRRHQPIALVGERSLRWLPEH
ncbi:hypothetical protein [Allokutzneria sp. NRRL B-24872]|uniref:hypothetical protein n=1 Tax=Allokutzneria sp. NRRL B-24872 TaxID=1137961 RepID=UPI00143D86F6|nr:hypothetical protein [Allokutzneria sp. NRRL B-24872]